LLGHWRENLDVPLMGQLGCTDDGPTWMNRTGELGWAASGPTCKNSKFKTDHFEQGMTNTHSIELNIPWIRIQNKQTQRH
jgi:hypothetical protein